MWQTVLVLLVVAAVLVYVVRHYVKVFRSETPSCSGCSGCSCSQAQPVDLSCDCSEIRK